MLQHILGRHAMRAIVIGALIIAPMNPGLSAQAPSRGTSEGIKVHGDWTIEIMNPDGTLVTRHEFKNALVPAGSTVMTGLLTGAFRAGSWMVQLTGPTQEAGPCKTAAVPIGGCFLLSTGDPWGDPILPIFRNLSTVVSSGGLELKGTATAGLGGEISEVSTGIATCSLASATCQFANGQGSEVTKRVFQSPIVVAAGQIVQVKVLISFS